MSVIGAEHIDGSVPERDLEAISWSPARMDSIAHKLNVPASTLPPEEPLEPRTAPPGYCHNCYDNPVSVLRSMTLCWVCADEAERENARERRRKGLQTQFPKFTEDIEKAKAKLKKSWGVTVEGHPGNLFPVDMETCYLSGGQPSYLVCVLSVGSEIPEDALAGENLRLREDWVSLSAEERGNNIHLAERIQTDGGYWIAPHSKTKPSFIVVELNLHGRVRS